MDRAADVRARDLELGFDGASFVVDSPIGSRRIETRLMGRFNVYNWLAAMCVAIGQGLEWDTIERAVAAVSPVRGRVQQIAAGQPFTVLVDFAHTPQALAAVLADCRRLTEGRLIVVFGHPGERYAENRPLMGAAAVRGADLAIATRDDTYGEDPMKILDGIVAGASSAGGIPGGNLLVIPDRRQAIREALRLAQAGDLVLIAGRGHLRFRVDGQQVTAFDDAQVVRQLLRGLKISADDGCPRGPAARAKPRQRASPDSTASATETRRDRPG
jgi:UDP-N-acetylmuramoyl-L-alanyl-D-glutamate--2,6-diaminopimelate ligase